MSTQNYTDTETQLHVQFRTPPTLSDNYQPNSKYIQNQHLSTPPSNQRAKSGTLGDGRNFSNPQTLGAYVNRFQLPQINTMYSAHSANVNPQFNISQ